MSRHVIEVDGHGRLPHVINALHSDLVVSVLLGDCHFFVSLSKSWRLTFAFQRVFLHGRWIDQLVNIIVFLRTVKVFLYDILQTFLRSFQKTVMRAPIAFDEIKQVGWFKTFL